MILQVFTRRHYLGRNLSRSFSDEKRRNAGGSSWIGTRVEMQELQIQNKQPPGFNTC